MSKIAYSHATVFGAGQVGMTLAEQLGQNGVAVTLVNRSGQAHEPLPAGVSMAAADLTDAASVARLAGRTEVVFATAQPPYTRWPELWPPLVNGLIEGMAQTDARLVFVDNLYMYGPTGGAPLREELPYAASGRKGRTRAAVAAALLEAHKAGKVQVAIGRAADFYGPRAVDTAVFGDRFFAAVAAGKAVDLFGDPDLPHTYTYVPDFAHALITLSEQEKAYGRAWHVPNAPTISTRAMLKEFETALGRPIRSRVASPLMLSLVGLFAPIVREMAEMSYQFTQPYCVDDSQFRNAFGAQVTPLAEAVAATVAWHNKS